MSVRPYGPEDWDAIARIHDTARLDELRGSVGVEAFLTLAETHEEEGLFDGGLWVAEVADGACSQPVVAGFAAVADAELTWLYVDPARYRQGIGRALLRHVLEADDPARIECTVLAGNDSARALYESAGFVVVETKAGKLAGNERFAATGHVMEWHRP
ncbi:MULTISPECIES: GNAT family N-acetyltransferase [unclassified Streptomyces]|uniref:GNAT family N-acetyltransferase n=1 Tax=unclassified Streptomyces TaxID=2593676 RepID=UPI0018FE8DF2|nr:MULTISPECIES: N-acetyltransferase [unclassified Streptomyces]MBT2380907.1 GNAT family N-acetyltransferase [Streptomyces sp. ISL-111]MBT2429682.1 GNAT family N-acetyltransferase [Streptomyces sp. ISL-112]MBT2464799.1 GNAT family N-acetyltransferase [Streptomyces sp. ISL-63]